MEQIQYLLDELENIKSVSSHVYEVICGIRDYLSQLNSQTTGAILKARLE